MRWRRLRAGAAIALLAMGLPGCGGEGGVGPGVGGDTGGASTGGGPLPDGSFAGNAQSAAEYRDKLTSDEAYHLLRRAAFGARPEDVDLAVRRGLNQTVDALLEERTLPAELADLAALYEDNIPKRWMVYLLESPNPLRERMAIFWHDRFAASQRILEGWDRNLAVLHWQMLRDNALGNYRTFLQKLTLDPLMLLWLDGARSPKEDPNENYAREFWELFTLGRDVLYTEQDIRESARAFTGITLLRDNDEDARPIYDLLHHDETLKHLLPSRAEAKNYDYLGVIDLTLAQPEAARYVVRNIFAMFVHDHPSDALVDDLARQFASDDFEIAPLVRRILRSQAMFSGDARGSRLTSPVEHVVGVARTLDMHMYSEDSQGYTLDRLVDDLRGAGQELLNPPAVNGWDEKGWLKDQWVLRRAGALGDTMEFGPKRRSGLPYHLLPDESTWDQREARDAIVDAMAGVFHLQLTDEEREIYIEVLDQGGWRALHLEEPEYRADQVFEMIRLMAMDERVIGL